jgi:hypothetical protein
MSPRSGLFPNYKKYINFTKIDKTVKKREKVSISEIKVEYYKKYTEKSSCRNACKNI